MLKLLSGTKTLWVTFLLTIALTVCFGLVMQIWQFGIIDEMYVAKEISAHIAAMTERQRQVHAWMTGTLDVAYPFAYGAFFIGVAVKSFGRWGRFFAAPSFLVIPADLTEGFSQIMLLNGHEHFMWLKEIATPVKLGLFGLGLLITAIGLLIGLRGFLKTQARKP